MRKPTVVVQLVRFFYTSYMNIHACDHDSMEIHGLTALHTYWQLQLKSTSHSLIQENRIYLDCRRRIIQMYQQPLVQALCVSLKQVFTVVVRKCSKGAHNYTKI